MNGYGRVPPETSGRVLPTCTTASGRVPYRPVPQRAGAFLPTSTTAHGSREPGEYAPDMDLNGTAAIVSGGASGLGAATARVLAAAGATVVVADLNEEHGKRVADEVGR